MYGNQLTTTNPAATGVPEVLPPPPPPPPRTYLLHHPRKQLRLGPRAPAPTVSFRFSAQGEATYYRCRLDSRPNVVCASPRKYRVGVGSHVFKVRAFGPGGKAPAALVYRFSVQRLKPKPKKPKQPTRRHHGPPRAAQEPGKSTT
jgi:hypothetical protein